MFVKSSLPMLEISEFPIVITEKSRFNSLALEIISNVPELNSLLFISPIIKDFILLLFPLTYQLLLGKPHLRQ